MKYGEGKQVAPEEPWERRVFEQHLVLSEYGAAGWELYRSAPSREYRSHVAILQGKARKQAEEHRQAEREAKHARRGG